MAEKVVPKLLHTMSYMVSYTGCRYVALYILESRSLGSMLCNINPASINRVEITSLSSNILAFNNVNKRRAIVVFPAAGGPQTMWQTLLLLLLLLLLCSSMSTFLSTFLSTLSGRHRSLYSCPVDCATFLKTCSIWINVEMEVMLYVWDSKCECNMPFLINKVWFGDEVNNICNPFAMSLQTSTISACG